MRGIRSQPDAETAKFLEHDSGQDFWWHLNQQGGVQLAVAQSAQHFPGGHVVKLNAYAGIVFVKKTQCAREQFHCQGWRVADVNFAELPTGDSFDRLHRFIHRCTAARASRRKTRPASVSLSALGPWSKSATPSSSSRSRIRRLRNVKPGRCARDAFFFGDGDKVSQVAELHPLPAYPFSMVSQATRYFPFSRFRMNCQP